MSTNVKINIAADMADLTVKAQLTKAKITELTRDLNRLAKEQIAGDASPELTARALKLADALVQERAALAGINRDISGLASAQTAAVGAASNLAAATKAGAASTGTMKFAMRDLSYQISDITTMFAMGAKPMQIFASQGGQVVGALSMMAGEAKGVLGVLGGPWGMIATSAAVALSPLIAKLFETGDAAKQAEIKIMGFANILAKARTKPMEALGDARADYFKEIEKLNKMKAGNDPNVPLPGTRNIAELRKFNEAIGAQEAAVEAAKSAWDDLQTRVKTNEQLFSISTKAGRFRAGDVDSGADAGGAKGAGRAAAQAYRSGFDEEMRALQKTTDKLEETVFKPWADRTKEGLKRRDDNAAKYLMDRLAVVKQANAAELAETRRFEEQKRAIQERTVAPFAQSIARMLTLQRGFTATLRDLWGSLTGVVEQAVTRMVQSFLIGLLTQEVAQEASSRKAIIGKAKEAAANAWNAVVGIPIVGPVLAPIAAAASFAGVMAFASAEQGWDVPGGGGAGIDGRGGRPAIIHPREMVLPASIADSVRSGALASTAKARLFSDGGDLAAAIAARPIAFREPGQPTLRSSDSAGPGGRRSRRGDVTNVHLNLTAVDASGVRRFLIENKHSVAEAVSRSVRDGYRGHMK